MDSRSWFAARHIKRAEGVLMLLVIPDIRQSADYDCGDAVVSALARFHGIGVSGGISNAIQGTDPGTVEAVVRRWGLPVVSGTLTLADLAHFTKTGRPVLCPVAAFGGHWVIVRGIDRGRVHVHCPFSGPTSTPSAKWVAEWRDVSRAGHEFDRWGIVAG